MGGVTHLLLLLWVGVTVSTAVDLQKRIIGGTKCSDKDRLYHVKLLDENENLKCGGSLISNQWVLTAAHCKGGVKKAVVGVHPGTNKKVQISARSVIFEKNENEHDIMLLKLAEPTDIAPVKLPDCANRPSGVKKDKVQIAGHAITVTGPYKNRIPGESSDLQCADVDVIACPWLSNPSSKPNKYESRFCGETSGVDVCPGDCGGGAVHNGMIYGVISTSGKTTCTTPVNFMDVCAYMDWIKKTAATTLLAKAKN